MNTVEKTTDVGTWEQAAQATAILSRQDNVVGNVSFKWSNTAQAYIIRWTEKIQTNEQDR